MCTKVSYRLLAACCRLKCHWKTLLSQCFVLIKDMIGKMNVGIRPSEAEELFELFDTDASGGIDDKEFMKALFPDDYRRIYMRTTTNTMSFQ